MSDERKRAVKIARAYMAKAHTDYLYKKTAPNLSLTFYKKTVSGTASFCLSNSELEQLKNIQRYLDFRVRNANANLAASSAQQDW